MRNDLHGSWKHWFKYLYWVFYQADSCWVWGAIQVIAGLVYTANIFANDLICLIKLLRNYTDYKLELNILFNQNHLVLFEQTSEIFVRTIIQVKWEGVRLMTIKSSFICNNMVCVYDS